MLKHILRAEVDIKDPFGANFGLDPMFAREPPQTIGEFVSNMLPQIYTVSLILVLVYLIWGGYRYLISGGDPKAVQAAKQHLTWAIAGMIFIFLSYWLFQTVDYLLLDTFDAL